ncbi:hypothetical protein [Umezakia ovalisporum]|uniref:hypothetical protein n=1 Tax=Umezakia ovalisporum TaxID=75695 RepID=UPI0024767700|nr:hypothetical protein [Umezakia ovalisporum]MDH6087290.1 hypothetical protein [Umezakia ovalisporum Ak1311]
MSQDNQNSQPSSSPVPKPNQPQLPDEQVNESRQLPTWKLKIIQILRGTMRILDTVVVQLETSPPPVTEGTLTFWQHLERQWNRFLRQVRLFLPSNVSNNLSDIVLTGILAVIILAIVWSTATIFTEKPTEIATVTPVEEVSPPTPKITIAPELTTPEPIPEPTPILKLTPEEALIAAIENQVAEISDRFASGLIGSIQANFRTSNLTLKINDDWYTLPESEQKQLATEILQRARELDFTHLEIVDSQDRLIARNPVVGNEMIIFQFIFQNLTINPKFKLYLV